MRSSSRRGWLPSCGKASSVPVCRAGAVGVASGGGGAGCGEGSTSAREGAVAGVVAVSATEGGGGGGRPSREGGGDRSGGDEIWFAGEKRRGDETNRRLPVSTQKAHPVQR